MSKGLFMNLTSIFLKSFLAFSLESEEFVGSFNTQP